MTNAVDFFVTTASSTALILFVAWLAKQWILTRLGSAVRHEFDEKLTRLASDLRKQEKQLQTQIERGEKELEAMRSSALSSRAAWASLINEKRVQALHQLWEAAVALSFAKGLTSSLAVLNLEYVAEQLESDPKMREFVRAFNGDVAKLQEPLDAANRSRVFVPDVVWGYFSAYQAVLSHAVVTANFFNAGINPYKFLTWDVVDLVREALPELSIPDRGLNIVYASVERLETKLLAELKKAIDGVEINEAELETSTHLANKVSSMQLTSVATAKVAESASVVGARAR